MLSKGLLQAKSGEDRLLEGLASTDTSDARLQIYQRLLYSSSASEQILKLAQELPEAFAPRTLALLRTIDVYHLSVERNSRVRNLSRHLERAAPRLTSFLGLSVHRNWVDQFASAPEFWSCRGRSLAENFCLFVAMRLNDQFLRAVAHLDGVMSGIRCAPQASSPWTGRVPHPLVPGSAATEMIESPVRLLTAQGALPTPGSRAYVGDSVTSNVAVVLYPEGTTLVVAIGAAE